MQKHFELPISLCPRLVESFEEVGTLLPEIADQTGLATATKVYAGGADNACGAIGAGILSEGQTMCSIGTSGVVLSYEERKDLDFEGKVHFFNHGEKDAFYIMGVTLAAGYSLSWFKDTFAADKSFDVLLQGIDQIPAGSNGSVVHTIYRWGAYTSSGCEYPWQFHRYGCRTQAGALWTCGDGGHYLLATRVH